MKVFVAGASSEYQYTKGVLAFRALKLRPGDRAATHYGATGLVARKALCSEFLRHKEFDALMMLDLDMDYHPDILERLRFHDEDIVAGHYYRRQLDPAMSLVETSPDGTWPYMPMLDPPREGLHEIACAGFGCVLIKRAAIEAVAKTLPPLAHPFDDGPLEWLTGSALSLGPDKRFFAMARKLGFKMYLDASVRCKHAVTAWFGDELYDKIRDRKSQGMIIASYWLENLGRHGVNEKSIKFRMQSLYLEREALLAEFNKIREGKTLEELQPYVLKLNAYDNRMAECMDWINGLKGTVIFPIADETDRAQGEAWRINDPGVAGDELRNQTMTSVAMSWVEMLDERPAEG